MDRFNSSEDNDKIGSSFETLEDVIWDWCDKQINRTKNMVDEMENTWK